MKLACVFTGQGSQSAQMGERLKSFPVFEEMIETYQSQSALPLQHWLFEATDEALARTEVSQPSIYFYGLVAYLSFLKHFQPSGWVYAGHSLGEYTALAASGVLDSLKALGVVHIRGKQMQEACPEQFGSMAAVLTRNVDDVLQACEEISGKFGENNALVAANFNSDRQVVVSGRLACIRMIQEKARDYGFQKVISLNVSAPFHSPYMSRMKEGFSKTCLDAIQLNEVRDTEGVYLPNVTAEPLKIQSLTKQQVLALLLEQLDHPVRWSLTTKHLAEMGQLDAVVEFGPKAVLGPMMKKQLSCPTYFVGEQKELDEVVGALQSLQ